MNAPTSALGLLFPGHDCQTGRFCNPAVLTNGQLLDAAEATGFEVLGAAAHDGVSAALPRIL